ncbi:hypothetical protein [Streptomyces scabichelini]|nr:hypothetical protein [Streptomyces scabichelini]
MLPHTPALTAQDRRVLDEIDTLRTRLRHQIHGRPRPSGSRFVW